MLQKKGNNKKRKKKIKERESPPPPFPPPLWCAPTSKRANLFSGPTAAPVLFFPFFFFVEKRDLCKDGNKIFKKKGVNARIICRGLLSLGGDRAFRIWGWTFYLRAEELEEYLISGEENYAACGSRDKERAWTRAKDLMGRRGGSSNWRYD